MAIRLWAVRFERSMTAEERERALALLPPERQARGGPDAVLWAYLLLRLALRETLGWAEFPELTYGERGKPAFRDYPEVCFSLSHTRGGALVGVGERPLGVDLERLRPMRAETMDRIAGTGDETEFFRCWVRRESRTKRTGAGIGAMLRQEPPLEPGETYEEPVTFPGYAAGVSGSGEEICAAVRCVDPKELLELTFSAENV